MEGKGVEAMRGGCLSYKGGAYTWRERRSSTFRAFSAVGFKRLLLLGEGGGKIIDQQAGLGTGRN